MTRSTPVIAVMITFSIALARADLASASASRMGAQQTDETQPVSIVQTFLLARDMGDFSGAESWCAPLLELQDDDSWFVDQPTMGDWLRRLTDEYIIDTVSPPRPDAKSVSWTERLTRRGTTSPEARPSRMTVDVHAVVRDGKITYLSGPYPPIPLHTPRAPMVSVTESRSAAPSHSPPTMPPLVLFTLCALALAAPAFLATRIGRSHRERR